MGDHQVPPRDPLVAEQQDVDIDHPRAPSPGQSSPALLLHVLGGRQKFWGRARPTHLQHLVEKPRLVGVTPWLGLDDAALTHNAHPFLTQPPSRRAQVPAPVAQVGAEPQVGDGAYCLHRMRSATRATRVIASTSCTRTISAPRRTAAVIVAAVPSTRSPTGRSSTLPMNDLREVPTRIGCRSSRNSSSLRITTQLWSAVLPKPMPGSMITRSRGTPAATAILVDSRRQRLISLMRSSAYTVPSWLCMAARAQWCRAARLAMAGERVSPQTSFRMVAPAETAASATSSLYVSIETGTLDSRDRRCTTLSVRAISSFVLIGTCPGRVDSPPTSRKSAPSRTIRMPCATAAAWSSPRPSPLNESGVTFTIPMM